MDTVSLAKRRYTTKAYDASRRIPQATVDALLEQLRHSPSSVNSVRVQNTITCEASRIFGEL